MHDTAVGIGDRDGAARGKRRLGGRENRFPLASARVRAPDAPSMDDELSQRSVGDTKRAADVFRQHVRESVGPRLRRLQRMPPGAGQVHHLQGDHEYQHRGRERNDQDSGTSLEQAVAPWGRKRRIVTQPQPRNRAKTRKGCVSPARRCEGYRDGRGAVRHGRGRERTPPDRRRSAGHGGATAGAMSVPLTQVLAATVPGGSRVKGRAYFLDRAVTQIEGDAWSVEATVHGSRNYRVSIKREGPVFSGSCECPYFEDRFVVCKHIWATMLEAERRHLLAGDGDVPRDAVMEALNTDEVSDPEFRVRSPRQRQDAPNGKGHPAWERFLEEFSRTLTEADAARPPARFSAAQIVYVIDRAATLNGTGLALEVQSRQRKKNGDWAKPKPTTVALSEIAQLPDLVDREIVPLLLGATDPYNASYLSQYGRASFRLAGPLVDRVLPLVVQSGRALLRARPQPGEEIVPLAWDDGLPWTFHLEIVHGSGAESFSIDGALIRGNDRR